MRIIKLVQLTACAILLGAILGAGAKADEWNRKTVATFSDSVEIPGKFCPQALTSSNCSTAFRTETLSRSGTATKLSS